LGRVSGTYRPDSKCRRGEKRSERSVERFTSESVVGGVAGQCKKIPRNVVWGKYGEDCGERFELIGGTGRNLTGV